MAHKKAKKFVFASKNILSTCTNYQYITNYSKTLLTVITIKHLYFTVWLRMLGAAFQVLDSGSLTRLQSRCEPRQKSAQRKTGRGPLAQLACVILGKIHFLGCSGTVNLSPGSLLTRDTSSLLHESFYSATQN